MKFLTFTDLHEDKAQLRELVNRANSEDVDFVVCCGDISTFGAGLKNVLRSFDKIEKPFYVIPGNHEEHLEWEKILDDFNNCINLHLQAIEVENYIFLGYGGDGFSQEDKKFRKISRDWYGKYNGKKIIMVTHGPPLGTKLDWLENRHVGNKDYRKFIQRIKPKLAISGHLHETVGLTDTIAETKLINPGWEGMIIELN
jgi:Icc-related predicted phosphoesterase